jgi:hypothetical protein
VRGPVSRYAPNSRKLNHMALAQATIASLLTIRLLAPNAVPRSVLTRAQTFAANALARAGIRVTWVRCPCDAPPRPADAPIQILERQPFNLSRDAAGFAVTHPGAGGYAALSYPQVRAAAAQCDRPPFLVLGATMAHEIGHLLLGSQAHSPRGVMSARIGCPELRLASRGELRFDPDEARRMRAEVARRQSR